MTRKTQDERFDEQLEAWFAVVKKEIQAGEWNAHIANAHLFAHGIDTKDDGFLKNVCERLAFDVAHCETNFTPLLLLTCALTGAGRTDPYKGKTQSGKARYTEAIRQVVFNIRNEKFRQYSISVGSLSYGYDCRSGIKCSIRKFWPEQNKRAVEYRKKYGVREAA